MISACVRVGREADSITLIAVSKTFPADCVLEAVLEGQIQFGESKLQEAEAKISALPETLEWHFIGRVQRNKVRKMLENFDVIHGVDSLRLATCINDTAKRLELRPKVFLQVNIGSEESKGGYEVCDLHAEIGRLFELERLDIQGLMCIPPNGSDAEAARPWFSAMRELRNRLETENNVSLSALSMGMSSDYEIAIEEGATHVRVGSAIFGTREYNVTGESGQS